MVSSQENWLPETLAARNSVSETPRRGKSSKVDMTRNTSTTCILSYTDSNMTYINTVSNLSLSGDVTRSQALLSTGISSKHIPLQSLIQPAKYHQSYTGHAPWTGNVMTSTNTNTRHNNCEMGYHNINYCQPNAMFYSGYGENCSLRSLANPDFITGPWSNSMLWYEKQSNLYLNQHELVSKEHLFPNTNTPMQSSSTDEIHQTIPYHHITYQPSFPSITCKLPIIQSSLPGVPVKSSISKTITQPYVQPLMHGDGPISCSEIPQNFSQQPVQYTNYSTEPSYPPSCSHEPSPTRLSQYLDICTNTNNLDKITDPEVISTNFEKDFAGCNGYTHITLGQGINPRGLPYISKEPLYSCLPVYVHQGDTLRNSALGIAEKPVISNANTNSLSKINQVDVVGFDQDSKSSNQIEDSGKVSLPNKITTVASKVTIPTSLLDCECKVCGKILARKSTLKIHMRQHTGDRPFNCLTCGKSFAQAGLLQSHFRVHTGERPYTCSHCRKRFSHSGALKTHLRTHTGERPHKCPIVGCNLAFGDSSTLSKHRRTHTGERPYACDICDKRFTQSGNMHKHRKSVHRAKCTNNGHKQKIETLEITPESSNKQLKNITCAK